MKSIVDILNSMVQAPADPSGSLKKGLSAISQDPTNGESFENVLSRLTAQTAASAGNGGTQNDSATSIGSNQSSGDVRSLNNASATVITNKGVEALDKPIASLVSALSQTVKLVSDLQSVPADQAQNTLASTTGGKITPSQAADLLNKIDVFKNEASGKNPLDLNAGQQAALIGQLLQNAIQTQQVTLVQNGKDANVSNTSTDGRPSGSIVLQIDLSGTSRDFSLERNGNVLSLDLGTLTVGIDTSKTSSLSSEGSRTNLTQATAERLTRLLQDLQVTPASKSVDIKVQSAIALPENSAEMHQNFKDLVQVLTQVGAGQAVLNTFLTREKANPAIGAVQDQGLQPENVFRGGLPAVELAPVKPVDASGVQGEAIRNEQNHPSLFDAPQIETGSSAKNLETVFERSLLSAEKPMPQSSKPVGGRSMVAEKNTIVVPEQNVLDATRNPGRSSSQIPLVDTPVNQVAVSHVSQVLQSPIVPVATVTNQANVQIPNTQAVLGQNDSVAINASNKPLAQAQPALVDGHLEAVNNIVARFNSAVVHGKIAATNTLRSVDPGTVQEAVMTKGAQEPATSVPFVAKTGSVPSSTPVELPNVVNSSDVQAQLNQSNSPATQQAHSELDPIVKNDVLRTLSETGSSTISSPNEQPLVATPSAATFSQGIDRSLTPVVIQQPIMQSGNPVQVTVPLVGTAGTKEIAPQAPVVTAPVTISQPASTAPNIPATAVVGEAVKAVVPSPMVENTVATTATPQVVTSVSSVPAVQPATAQAVTQVSTTLGASGGATVSSNLDKDTSSDVLNIEAAVGAASASISASHVGKTGDYEKVATNVGSSNVSNMDPAQVLGQISRQVAAQTAASRTVTQLNFQLFPESLGRVTVQVALIDQSVSARIVVSNPEVREILQHHMVDLKSALSQAGLQIDQLQVQVQGGGASLLAQYYQYQQEGGAYRSPAGVPVETLESPEILENKGFTAVSTGPLSLVNLLV